MLVYFGNHNLYTVCITVNKETLAHWSAELAGGELKENLDRQQLLINIMMVTVIMVLIMKMTMMMKMMMMIMMIMMTIAMTITATTMMTTSIEGHLDHVNDGEELLDCIILPLLEMRAGSGYDPDDVHHYHGHVDGDVHEGDNHGNYVIEER